MKRWLEEHALQLLAFGLAVLLWIYVCFIEH